jgi:hypothetical protein
LYWERNYFAAVLPMLHVVITNAYVRGAISGLGLVNLVAAVSELRSLLAARRVAGSDLGRTRQPFDRDAGGPTNAPALDVTRTYH